MSGVLVIIIIIFAIALIAAIVYAAVHGTLIVEGPTGLAGAQGPTGSIGLTGPAGAGGGGNVSMLTPPSTPNDIAVYSDASGTVIKDSGVNLTVDPITGDLLLYSNILLTNNGISIGQIGLPLIAIGLDSIRLGNISTAAGSHAVSIGYATTAGGDDSSAIGQQASSSGPLSIAIGSAASATGIGSIALGANAVNNVANSLRIGLVNTQVYFTGGQYVKITTITANYQVLPFDYILAVTISTSDITVTLPPASVSSEGQVFIIKDVVGLANSFPITVMVSGGANIDGSTSVSINTNFGVLRVVCLTSHSWSIW